MRKLALNVVALPCLLWVTFNIAFDLGVDTALCVVTHMETREAKEQIRSCRDAKPVEGAFVQGLRQTWLWLLDDEVPA